MAKILAFFRSLLARWSSRSPDVRPVLLLPAPPPPPDPPIVTMLAPTGTDATVPLSAPAIVDAAPAPRLRRPRGLSIVWHFRSTILDRLDEYFGCMERLRRHDPTAYSFFSRIGFSITDAFANPECADQRAKLATIKHLAFGGLLVPRTRSDDGFIQPSFVYFRKVKRPRHVEPWVGDVYSLTCVYDDRSPVTRRARLVVPVTCHLGLGGDGAITLLHEAVGVRSDVYTRGRTPQGRRSRRRRLSLTTWSTRYPDWLYSLADERGQDPLTFAPVFVRDLFTMVLATYTESISRIVIRAERGGCVAAFAIDHGRAKYFFADREGDLTAEGHRRRIFHSVIGHTRVLGDGRTTDVREHYRGLRDFAWKGCQVHIVLPTNRCLEFEAAAVYQDEIPPADRPQFQSEAQTAKALAAVLDA